MGAGNHVNSGALAIKSLLGNTLRFALVISLLLGGFMVPAAYTGQTSALAYAEELPSVEDDELVVPVEEDEQTPAEENEQPSAGDDELPVAEKDDLASAGDDELFPAGDGAFAAFAGEGAFTVLAVNEVTVGASKDYATPQAALTAIDKNNGQPWTMILYEDFIIDQLAIGDDVDVTIRSENSASPHTLTATPGKRHILIYPGGCLTLRDVVLTGGSPPHNIDAGGSVFVLGGTFIMQDGAVIQGSSTDLGAAVAVTSPQPSEFGTFIMEGGTISGNNAWKGGAVFVGLGQPYPASATMKGGTISGNFALDCGGGVAVGPFGSFTLEGGTISGNSAGNGGGVAVTTAGASLTLKSGAISNNVANQDGGGIWYDNGGEINLAASDAVVFTGNSAQKLYLPDAEPQPVASGEFVGTVSSLSADFTAIGYPGGYPYAGDNTILAFNNYDILNTASTYRLAAVTFDATGGSFADGTGSTFVDVWPSRTLGNRMPVPPERADWTFIGWATSPGDQIPNFSGKTVVSASLTVYALWGHRVTYHGQGNTSGSVPQDTKIYANGATVDVAAAGDLEKAGYHFVGWSTNPADTTALYQPGDSFTIVRNTDLYAVWQLAESTSLPATGDNSTLIGLLAGVVLVLAVVCIGRGLRPMRGPGVRGIGLHSRVASQAIIPASKNRDFFWNSA